MPGKPYVRRVVCSRWFGIGASMSHDARQYSPTGREPVIVEPGREDDLPAIMDILNYTIMNSNATLATQPVTRHRPAQRRIGRPSPQARLHRGGDLPRVRGQEPPVPQLRVDGTPLPAPSSLGARMAAMAERFVIPMIWRGRLLKRDEATGSLSCRPSPPGWRACSTLISTGSCAGSLLGPSKRRPTGPEWQTWPGPSRT